MDPAPTERPIRIDLDGVPLDDEDGRTTAIFRFRTTSGLVLALPESVDVTIPFGDLAEASLDLLSGLIRIRFADEAARRHAWLGRARRLTGAWTDRRLLTAPPR
jgi:hypothetical protein